MLRIPRVFFGHAGELSDDNEQKARFHEAFPHCTYLDAPDIAARAKMAIALRDAGFLDLTFEESCALTHMYQCAHAATGRTGDVVVTWSQGAHHV